MIRKNKNREKKKNDERNIMQIIHKSLRSFTTQLISMEYVKHSRMEKAPKTILQLFYFISEIKTNLDFLRKTPKIRKPFFIFNTIYEIFPSEDFRE
jgi:NADH:ubiquinone oxidoreductase subunit C